MQHDTHTLRVLASGYKHAAIDMKTPSMLDQGTAANRCCEPDFCTLPASAGASLLSDCVLLGALATSRLPSATSDVVTLLAALALLTPLIAPAAEPCLVAFPVNTAAGRLATS